MDWPLFEYDEEEGRYYAAHHPFTMPFDEDMELMETNPEQVRAQAYDYRIKRLRTWRWITTYFRTRITRKNVQSCLDSQKKKQMHNSASYSKHLNTEHLHMVVSHSVLTVFVMLLAGRTNLRDTIAFPKTASASDLLVDAPSTVSDKQLAELSLRLAALKK